VKHAVIQERSADEEEEEGEGENEGDKSKDEYEEYEEEYEDDDAAVESGQSQGFETVAKIKVVWSGDEDDLYVDDHLQAARMWGIIQGQEGEDFISVKEDDDVHPANPDDSTMLFIPFTTPPPLEYSTN
jgi:hypothetical protein